MLFRSHLATAPWLVVVPIYGAGLDLLALWEGVGNPFCGVLLWPPVDGNWNPWEKNLNISYFDSTEKDLSFEKQWKIFNGTTKKK